MNFPQRNSINSDKLQFGCRGAPFLMMFLTSGKHDGLKINYFMRLLLNRGKHDDLTRVECTLISNLIVLRKLAYLGFRLKLQLLSRVNKPRKAVLAARRAPFESVLAIWNWPHWTLSLFPQMESQ